MLTSKNKMKKTAINIIQQKRKIGSYQKNKHN